ncbi:hypothetical protein Tco_0058126 [Tanacetum coccineum]
MTLQESNWNMDTGASSHLAENTVMYSSTHPIIDPSDYDVEDAFSSTHSPNYILASLDYFPALLGNTSHDLSDDLSKYLLASLAISPFHDDPYMKVMQAYNATNNESPIPPLRALIAPPTIFPSSPMLPQSPISRKTHLERHEEQIETILNHLDELPLECIEHMEDKIKEQIRHDDEIVLAHVRTSTLEILIEDIQVRHRSDMKSLLDKIPIAEKKRGRAGGKMDGRRRGRNRKEVRKKRRMERCEEKEKKKLHCLVLVLRQEYRGVANVVSDTRHSN